MPLKEEDLKSMQHIKRSVEYLLSPFPVLFCTPFCFSSRCLLEAVRLHAPGMIVRKVTETHLVNVRVWVAQKDVKELIVFVLGLHNPSRSSAYALAILGSPD